MEDNKEKELNEEELSQYLGGASKEVLAERYGIPVDKFDEVMQMSMQDPKLYAIRRGERIDYITDDGKIDHDHKMGR